MIEVFKTNVAEVNVANQLILKIHEQFKGYQANFDLEDCDLILRVENPVGEVDSVQLITLLKDQSFDAEILADELITN